MAARYTPAMQVVALLDARVDEFNSRHAAVNTQAALPVSETIKPVSTIDPPGCSNIQLVEGGNYGLTARVRGDKLPR